MPKTLTQYRVFIGSPGGLEKERARFRQTLERFTALHAEPHGVTFHPVGWEDTIGGVGRPQAVINEDLRQCDYAVFLLHDRWGSPTGSGHSSGTEEEWEVAEQLYQETKIRDIALLFKKVDSRQLRDPGEQLKRVLEFKWQIESGKKYLFGSYSATEDFCKALEAHLAKWLRLHEDAAAQPSSGELFTFGRIAIAAGTEPAPSPGYDYWILEAEQAGQAQNYFGALFCIEKALAVAHSEVEWAQAKHFQGLTHAYLNKLDDALAIFTAVVEHFEDARDPEKREWQARALCNKGRTLRNLGRNEDAIAVWDDVVVRFRAAPELPLREQVARVLVEKGEVLGKLERSEEAIAVWDDLVARFGTAPEVGLRQQAAQALIDKGSMLYHIGRLDATFGLIGPFEDAITVWEDVVARYGDAPEFSLRKMVALALFKKGNTLAGLGGSYDEQAIAVWDEIVARLDSAPDFSESLATALLNKARALRRLGRHEEAIEPLTHVVNHYRTAPELQLRQSVALALVYKGDILRKLDRNDEAVTVYNEAIARCGSALELPLRETLGTALLWKGRALRQLDRRKEAIGAWDDVVGRFGTASEPELLEDVAIALLDKGSILRELGRDEEAITAWDEVITRFGTSRELSLRENAGAALLNKARKLRQLGRSEEAIAAWDDVVGRFGTASEPELLEEVATALLDKGGMLRELGRDEEAMVVCKDVVARFVRGDGPLGDGVARSLVKLGLAELLTAG